MSINVNKRKFLRYEVVRKSGKYNMFFCGWDDVRECGLDINDYDCRWQDSDGDGKWYEEGEDVSCDTRQCTSQSDQRTTWKSIREPHNTIAGGYRQ